MMIIIVIDFIQVAFTDLKDLAAQDLLFFSSRKLAVIIIEINRLTILAPNLDAKVCLLKLNAILFVCKITMNVLLWGKTYKNPIITKKKFRRKN